MVDNFNLIICLNTPSPNIITFCGTKVWASTYESGGEHNSGHNKAYLCNQGYCRHDRVMPEVRSKRTQRSLLSRTDLGWKSQQPRHEDTQAAFAEVHLVKNRLPIKSRVDEPHWRWVLRPQASVQRTTTPPGNPRIIPSRETPSQNHPAKPLPNS